MTACEERVLQEDFVAQYANIQSDQFSIMPNESGSVCVYIGDEISVPGINLENISHIEYYYKDGDVTAKAEISNQEHKTISFIVPFFELAQSDAPYMMTLSIYDKTLGVEKPIYSETTFVTQPITDVVINAETPLSPMTGTLGDELTIAGRNLGQVSAITFGGQTIEAADFVAQEAGAIKFVIPAGTYDAGTSEVAVSVTWNGSTVTPVTETFELKTPKFDAYVAGVVPVLNDNITLTGENLDLVSTYMWDGFELTVVLGDGEVATSDKVTLYIPAVMDDAHTGQMTKDITAVWGTPEQAITVAKDFVIDATKLPIKEPVITAVRAEDDGGDTDALRFYLNKTVTLTGTDMAGISAVKVGGQAATLVGEPTGVECQFTMPDTFDFTTFTEATDMEIEITYTDNGTDYLSSTTYPVKVYPMYFYKDLSLGMGTGTSALYEDYSHDNAFFLPNRGEVISASDWRNETIDPFALMSPNPAYTEKNTINKSGITMEEYYSVEPYIFLYSDSGGKVSLYSASNSDSGLKNHRYIDTDGGYEYAATTYGTPLIYFRRMTSSSDYEPVLDGTMTAMTFDDDGSSACPALKETPGSTSEWKEGSVIAVIYSTYTHGAEKPNAETESHQLGYLVVKEVVDCLGLVSTSADGAVRDGYITFDFYWSPVRNAGE